MGWGMTMVMISPDLNLYLVSTDCCMIVKERKVDVATRCIGVVEKKNCARVEGECFVKNRAGQCGCC